MIAVALIALPLAVYIWMLLRAADDERTGWEPDEHPTFAPRHAQPGEPYSWGADETTYRWLLKDAGLEPTLAEIRALPTAEERVT